MGIGLRIAFGLTVTALGLAVAAPARADIDPGVGLGSPDGQLTVTGAGTGLTLNAFVGPETFNPLGGYPPATFDPLANGFTPADNPVFAGTINATNTAGVSVATYCVDLLTDTESGLSYNAAPWADAQIANLGFIARIVNDYFPQTGEPSEAANNAQRAAAVQAAIWFFSDRVVIDNTSPVYPLASSIVSEVLAAGPATEPPVPLVINGPSTGTAGTVIGPFTVQSTGPFTVTASGGQLFADAAGTEPITNGSLLPAGTEFFLRVSSPASVQIQATGPAQALPGNTLVYLAADPDNPEPAEAQTLILAEIVEVPASGQITIVVNATPTPPPAPPAPVLPVTGTAVAGLTATALALLTTGAILVRLGRRRRFIA